MSGIVLITIFFYYCRPLSILILGLEGSGKTEIGYFLSKKQRLDFSQTNGSQAFHLNVNNTPVNLNEIGGSADIRSLWVHYYREVNRTVVKKIC